MKELIKLTGMVLKASPIGEIDKRLVVLTKERGKITVFARGVRRQGSILMAGSRPFSFGVFRLYEGRDAYNLQTAEITNYFSEVSVDMDRTCYGSYFLELADYYTRENIEESGMLLLLYQSLRALSKPAIPNELVQRIYELKAMVINGEYTERPPKQVSDSANYTWEYVVGASLETLYTFTVTPDVLMEFSNCVEINKKKYVDRDFYSLEILHTLTGK